MNMKNYTVSIYLSIAAELKKKPGKSPLIWTLSRKTKLMKKRSIGNHKTQKLRKIHFNCFVR
jgi:hypothetical protein